MFSGSGQYSIRADSFGNGTASVTNVVLFGSSLSLSHFDSVAIEDATLSAHQITLTKNIFLAYSHDPLAEPAQKN